MCCETDIRFFKAVDFGEKIFEVVDESAHLVNHTIQPLFSETLSHFVDSIHDGVHNCEQLLHSICLLNDLTNIWRGKIYEGNIFSVIGRICHFISHLIAPIVLAAKLGILKVGEWVKTFNIVATCASALGYLSKLISVIWRFCTNDRERPTLNELGIQISGLLYHTISIIQFALPIAFMYTAIMQACCGIVHASFVIYHYIPEDHCHHHGLHHH